ncbi:alpha/beta family hydrolase [Variovorax sp.]|uniref:alpha/beta hydrolase family protein n=1 Tax=Variovorax sp. TaxID=1871043 RepID=UPI002D5867E1|nr:alpha/beta family hydrolase [Variovorax sp.]HYP86027.1 alpha/beta family hydrolase [Variovorax sp.]
MSPPAEPLAIALPDGTSVSGLVQAPAQARSAYVLAHGAGAGMGHAFLDACANGLAERGVASLRFQFPYMERGSRRPDSPAVAQATVRAAVARAAERFAGARLFAGGKSFGGRMTSQAQALAPLPGVEGLVFLGFPLHPADKPSSARADHLRQVDLPMLFVQGTRDKLAQWDLVQALVAGLGERARLLEIDQADHSFHVPARSGRTDAQVLDGILDAAAAWMLR